MWLLKSIRSNLWSNLWLKLWCSEGILCTEILHLLPKYWRLGLFFFFFVFAQGIFSYLLPKRWEWWCLRETIDVAKEEGEGSVCYHLSAGGNSLGKRRDTAKFWLGDEVLDLAPHSFLLLAWWVTWCCCSVVRIHWRVLSFTAFPAMSEALSVRAPVELVPCQHPTLMERTLSINMVVSGKTWAPKPLLLPEGAFPSCLCDPSCHCPPRYFWCWFGFFATL